MKWIERMVGALLVLALLVGLASLFGVFSGSTVGNTANDLNSKVWGGKSK